MVKSVMMGIKDSTRPAVVEETRRKAAIPSRRPPPMRVVTKGLWTIKEEAVDIEELREERLDGKR